MRASTFFTPNISLATWHAMMLVLSKLVTAANASALSHASRFEHVYVNACTQDGLPLEIGRQPFQGGMVRVDYADLVPILLH
jgi:hypothetical protein